MLSEGTVSAHAQYGGRLFQLQFIQCHNPCAMLKNTAKIQIYTGMRANGQFFSGDLTDFWSFPLACVSQRKKYLPVPDGERKKMGSGFCYPTGEKLRLSWPADFSQSDIFFRL